MPEMTYRERIDTDRIMKMRGILRDLPPACQDFISSIAVTTGTFTRLAYSIDLRTFFHFLTTERAAFSLKPLYAWMDDDLAAVSQSDLTAYIEYLTFYYKSSPDEDDQRRPEPMINHERAIKRKLCSIRSFYDYLFTNARVPANTAQLVALPKIHDKPIIRLNDDEVERILRVAEDGTGMTDGEKRFRNQTGKRDYAMLSLFLGTGIRVSECVGINLSDLDFEENAFLVTRKGGNQVVLYFPQNVADALQDYLVDREKIHALPGHEEALFLSIQRKRISQRAVEKLVKKYASYAAPLKTKISPHKLRSTYATNLYGATGDIYLVADALGHSSVETTKKHYADITDEHRRTASKHVHLPMREKPRDDKPTEQPSTIKEKP